MARSMNDFAEGNWIHCTLQFKSETITVFATEMDVTLGCFCEHIQAQALTALWARIKPHFLEVDIQYQNWFFRTFGTCENSFR